MSVLVTLVSDNLGALALGVSALLLVGWALGRVGGQPLSRQRWAELGALGALLWVPLALVPMPRPWQVTAISETAEVTPTRPSMDVSIPFERGGDLDRRRELLASHAAPSVDPAIGTSGRVDPVGVDPTPDTQIESMGLDPAHAESDIATRSRPVPQPELSLSTAPPSTRATDVRGTFAGIWLAGAAIAVAWVLLGALALCLRLRRTVRADADVERELCGDRVCLRLSPVSVLPFCAGLLRPTVVVPAALLADPSQLRAVVAHELAHLRQRDPWRRVLWAVALPLLWWHPLFWVTRRDAFLMAELVADDLAARDRCAYARQLLRLAESPAGAAPAPRAAIPIFRSASQLTRRIEVLLDNDQKFVTRSTLLARSGRAAAFVVTAGVLAAAFGAAPAAAQDPGRVDPATPRPAAAWRVLAPGDVDVVTQMQDPQDKKTAGEIQRLQKQYFKLMQQAQKIERQLALLKAQPNFDPGDDRVVVVKAGDSLGTLAKKHYGSSKMWGRIFKANPGIDPASLKVGMKLRIPAADAPKNNGGANAVDIVNPLAAAPSTQGVTQDPLVNARAGQAGRSRDSGNYGTMQILLQLVELRAQIETDQDMVARLEPLFEAGRIPSTEINDRKGRLAANHAKYEIVRMMAEGELEDAKLALRQAMSRAEYTQKLVAKGFVTQRQVEDDEFEVKRLARRYETLKKALR